MRVATKTLIVPKYMYTYYKLYMTLIMYSDNMFITSPLYLTG